MKAEASWKSRIVGEADVPPEQLLANPGNWRVHPGGQRDAIRGSLSDIGWVQRIIVNRTTGHVVDGHMRVEEALTAGAPTVPVIYVELSADEERVVLATLDPIGAMAVRDDARLASLLEDVSLDAGPLATLIERIRGEAPDLGSDDFRNAEWTGMPEYDSAERSGFKKVLVHFATEQDWEDFQRVIGQECTKTTRSIWYPEAPYHRERGVARYGSEE